MSVEKKHINVIIWLSPVPLFMSEDNPTEPIFRRSRRSFGLEGGHKPKISLSRRTILITLGVVILVGLVVFAGIASDNGSNQIVQSQPTPTEAQIPTEPPTPTETEETPTPEPSPSPTPKTSITPTKSASTSTVDKTSGLDRANLTVEVQNGSGVAGAATKASDLLKDLGYDVTSSGNADNFDYESTVIQVKSTKKGYLEILKKDLAEDYTISEATADLTGSTADALIIIGKN